MSNTETANIVQCMEDAAVVGDPSLIQADYPTDNIFRHFLVCVYDPFRQYGYTVRFGDDIPNLAVIPDAQAANEALEKEWTYWCEILEKLRMDGHDFRFQKEWKDSLAWPLYQRTLTKMLRDIKIETVAGVWGDVPLFRAGRHVKSIVEDYPAYAEPVFNPGQRLIALVNDPYRDSECKVDLFSSDGKCCAVPPDISGFLQSLRYGDWLSEADEFREGLVLDGIVHMVDEKKAAFLAYDIFDVKPVSHFRTCSHYKEYSVRRRLLNELRDFVDMEEGPVRVLTAIYCKDKKRVKRAQEVFKKCFGETWRGIMVKHVNGSYPHTAGTAWIFVEG